MDTCRYIDILCSFSIMRVSICSLGLNYKFGLECFRFLNIGSEIELALLDLV